MTGRMLSAVAALSSEHCRAICEEVGYRLATALGPISPDVPPRLADLLERLRLAEQDAPSIVPRLEDLSLSESPVMNA